MKATKKQPSRFPRSSIEVDQGGWGELTSVTKYFKSGHLFRSLDEARGAFKLAHQQGLDGMGASVQAWLGMSDVEFNDFMRNEGLPKRAAKHDPPIPKDVLKLALKVGSGEADAVTKGRLCTYARDLSREQLVDVLGLILETNHDV